ncbi:hypothetical protein Tco_0892782 [Tanacetum coccineum]|uniref:Reverse transcriptase domain-containing protein n=1 Tax=Tanacetum coccineum TaxID=301880 RepID=A0ABQ5C6W8_9ASTR
MSIRPIWRKKLNYYNTSNEVDVNLPTPMPKPQSTLNESSQENPPTTFLNHDSLQPPSLLVTLMLLSDYDCNIRYHPVKANVVADALSRKERIESFQVRAIVMTIGLDLPKRILEAQIARPENQIILRMKNVAVKDQKGYTQGKVGTTRRWNHIVLHGRNLVYLAMETKIQSCLLLHQLTYTSVNTCILSQQGLLGADDLDNLLAHFTSTSLHDPDYVPEPMYPEYIPLEDEHVFPAEEQPLPPVDSPTWLVTRYEISGEFLLLDLFVMSRIDYGFCQLQRMLMIDDDREFMRQYGLWWQRAYNFPRAGLTRYEVSHATPSGASDPSDTMSVCQTIHNHQSPSAHQQLIVLSISDTTPGRQAQMAALFRSDEDMRARDE